MTRISDLLGSGTTVSFEFFPPQDDQEKERLERTIRDLEPLAPSFVSVTYRGGRRSRLRTTEVVRNLLQERRVTAMPHLTCVAHSRAELVEIIGDFKNAGVSNVLALGGDPLPDGEQHELRHAVELVELARSLGVDAIGVAAHPAGHPNSPDLASDRRYLAEKLGLADFAITQFFFAADEYESLVDDLDRLGIRKPVIPGIMPITNLGQIQRMAQLSGCAVPGDVVAKLQRADGNPEEVRRIGLELAVELCQSLLDRGAPGLHFYTLNTSTATREIHRQLKISRPRVIDGLRDDGLGNSKPNVDTSP